MSTPERAGWYDDPEDESRLRYFDGIIWSDRTVPRKTHRSAPPVAAAPTAGHGTDPAAQGHVPTAPGTDVFGRSTGHPAGPPAAHPYGAQGGSPYGATPDGNQAQRTPEPLAADGRPLASYGSRAAAYMIDAAILGVLNVVLAGWAWWFFMADYWSFAMDLVMNDPGGQMPSVEQVSSMLNYRYFFIALAIGFVVEAIYHVGFLVARNATPGKLVMGISVQRVTGAGRLGVGVSFMRALLPLGLRVLWGLTCLFDVVVRAVDLLWPIKDPKQQALHDKIAGTQVVQGKQPRASDTPGPVSGHGS